MSRPWTPWHEVVDIRDDVKSGELSMETFAARLYDVVQQQGSRPIYEDPVEFFKLTFPTRSMRDLTQEVAERLRGEGTKAVRALSLAYGGGKTHTLITLFHLFQNPDALPDLPAVQEFRSAAGEIPEARVAAIPFNDLDLEKGIELPGPSGKSRSLVEPWSAIAYALAGDDGLRMLHGEGLAKERPTPPATSVLENLFRLPQEEGLSTLILLDEVLLYAYSRIKGQREDREPFINFCQHVTEAASSVNRCCVVASLLASESADDQLGKSLGQRITTIFRRVQDENVRPVEKSDVAEIMRRRFFDLDSIRNKDAFRPHVTAALKGIEEVDEDTAKRSSEEEKRYHNSYPFHPELIEVFYGKWTQLSSFQRARGMLRLMAQAIRDADEWDGSPLISSNIFLGPAGEESLSASSTELADTAAEGTPAQQGQDDWATILETELGRVRDLQDEYTGIQGREIEQALLAVFLHSQPKGREATISKIRKLVGHTRPDPIEMKQALNQFKGTSWYLDEENFPEDTDELPRKWRLGSKPNLTQMHDQAKGLVENAVERELIKRIEDTESLGRGAVEAGAKLYRLPSNPGDIKNDPSLHFAILGPDATSRPGDPNEKAVRFLEKKTSGEPRVNKNAVVLAVPSPEGLRTARTSVRDFLAWKEVGNMLEDRPKNPKRRQLYKQKQSDAKEAIPESIRDAYTVAVTLDKDGEALAFKVPPGDSLFEQIKAHSKSRIQETEITAEALLPGGPYDLWQKGETERRVQVMVRAFAEDTRLPKMLRPEAVRETIAQGCKNGTFVLRLTRPDGSKRTFWRVQPDEVALEEESLYAVLPEEAELAAIEPKLMNPGELPDLWEKDQITVGDCHDYFSGDTVIKKDYDRFPVPEASKQVVNEAVGEAVEDGMLWILNGNASLCGETVPTGILQPDAELHSPPQPVSAADLLPDNLSGAWSNETTTAESIDDALANQRGVRLPWPTVREAISGAFNANLLKRTVDSDEWPIDRGGAAGVKIKLPQSDTGGGDTGGGDTGESGGGSGGGTQPRSVSGSEATATLEPEGIQDLADEIANLMIAEPGIDFSFQVSVETSRDSPLSDDTKEKLNEVLSRVSDELQF
jgi:hypothetical protein